MPPGCYILWKDSWDSTAHFDIQFALRLIVFTRFSLFALIENNMQINGLAQVAGHAPTQIQVLTIHSSMNKY